MSKRILVSGAGGMIGGHMAAHLCKQGHDVWAVDKKPLDKWYQRQDAAINRVLDLSLRDNCRTIMARQFDEVYNFACNMGGIGFIETNRVDCMMSVLITAHMLQAAAESGVGRFFQSSSACVYNTDLQQDADIKPLAEGDAWPALPERGYGLEKLYGEELCKEFYEERGLETRVARYHNVYGPFTSYDDGREKAPAAICRKVIEAKLSGNHAIEIWGDGEQTRSFMYTDDCITGTELIMQSDVRYPINLGSSELVSINQLVDLAEEFAGIKVKRNYILDAPKGVRGRNSDNMLIWTQIGWEPSIALAAGLQKTYAWIWDRMT